jgi:hypothetical protein
VFFSEPSESDDGGVRIAGDAVDVDVGSAVRERIEVPELGEVGHSLIVTIFVGVEKGKTPRRYDVFRASKGRKYPH